LGHFFKIKGLEVAQWIVLKITCFFTVAFFELLVLGSFNLRVS